MFSCNAEGVPGIYYWSWFKQGVIYSVTALTQFLIKSVLVLQAIPSFAKVFSLYCALERGVRYSEFCSRYNLTRFGIDPIKFIIFGTMNQLIRKMDRFPLRLPVVSASSNSRCGLNDIALSRLPSELVTRLATLLDGTHSMTEIECELNMGYQQLVTFLQTYTDCVIVMKWKNNSTKLYCI